LHIAALIGHVDIIQFLLQRGTLPNTHDVSNNNVLSYAAMCDHEHLEVMRMLLKAGADSDEKSRGL